MTHAERQNVWATRLDAFKASGQSVAAWCADNDVKTHQLWYWIRKEKQTSLETSSAWLPLDLSETDFQPSLLVRVGHVTVEVKPGFDPKLLLDVVNTLMTQ